MRLLALDTSGRSQGLAVFQGGELLHESLLIQPGSHSETLLGSIESALEGVGWKVSDVEAYALTVGPGSFTGLRIAMSTVKGLCAAFPRPVVPVSTLLALALPLLERAAFVVPCLDAHCGEVFSGVYSRGDTIPQALQADRAWPWEEWLANLARLPGKKLLVGDAVSVYRERVEKIPELEWVEEERYHLVSPAAFGRLALEYFRLGRTQDAAELRPQYLRVSEAENRLRERQRGEGDKA